MLLAICCPLVARAQPMQLTYAGYVAGLKVFAFQAAADVTGRDYRVQTSYRTSGILGAFVAGDLRTRAFGIWRGDSAVPVQYETWGTWRGTPRRALIDYHGTQPVVRETIPPVANEREPVPPAAQADTIDTLSGFAFLVRRINATGHCAAKTKLFDGRRLLEIAVTDGGEEILAADSASMFAGPALRCDLSGRQTAGFAFDEGRDPLAIQTTGTLWFARPLPGAPLVPVRMTFLLHLFGHATMYLSAASLEPVSAVARPGSH